VDRHVGHRPPEAAQAQCQALARIADEAELVELTAKGEQDREPEEGGQRIPLGGNVIQREGTL